MDARGYRVFRHSVTQLRLTVRLQLEYTLPLYYTLC